MLHMIGACSEGRIERSDCEKVYVVGDVYSMIYCF